MNHTWTVVTPSVTWGLWCGPVNIIKQILENYVYNRNGLGIVTGAMSHSVQESNYWGNGGRERWLTKQQKQSQK